MLSRRFLITVVFLFFLGSCWINFGRRHVILNLDHLQISDFGLRGQLARDIYKSNLLRPLLWKEQVAIALFPFIQNPQRTLDPMPLKSLRARFAPGSQGIVIAAGKNNFRIACQLLASLYSVHNVTLPIAIAYGGDEDLPSSYRQKLQELWPQTEMLDVTTVLTDTFMNLKHGTWASKPFAALAAPYEQVLLLDSDAVFVRSPQDLMDQAKAQGVHTFLFQDRRLEQVQNSTRQQFIREQVQRAGIPETCCETMLDEAWIDLEDSGAVLINKKDSKALVGLLHTCWQNSAAVRDEVTYKVFYGDKETFWLGMALTGAPFTFEKHHSGIVGILQDRTDGNGNSKAYVCGNTIAHQDSKDELSWYNGSLLRHKARDQNIFLVPTHHMADGHCGWVADEDFSFCCSDGDLSELTALEHGVLKASVNAAIKTDLEISSMY